MTKTFLFLICILVSFKSAGQQQVPLNEKHYLDSLQHVLQKKIADSSRATTNFLLVEYWKFKDTLKSKAYLAAGTVAARNDRYLSALALFYKGQYYFNWNKPKASEAFKKAEGALSHFSTKKAYAKRAASWYNYALMNIDKMGYAFITKVTLEKAIPIAEKTGDPSVVAYYYTQLATILMNNYQFSKAASYNEKAIALLEKKAPRSTDLMFSYLTGVSINSYDNQGEKARKLLEKAQRILKPYPSSLNYPLYYYNEALYYSTIKSFDKALNSIDKGVTLAKKYNQQQLYQQFFFRRYDVYQQQKKYGKARQILLDIVKEGTLTAKINDRVTIYSELAKMSEKLGDYKEAYHWLNNYSQASDSISSDQTKVKINELETRYRSAKSLQKIQALQSENRQAQLGARNDNLYKLILGMGCLFLLLLLVFVLFSARSRRKLARQREINYRQQLSEMERKQQLKIAKAMLEGEELERERVARDLHDGLGGMLSGVKIGLSGLTDTQRGITDDKDLHRIIGQLDSSVTELRRIARNMVPETLLKFGLETALKDLCEFYMRDGLLITSEMFGIKKDIAMNVQLNIYRIVQELISNAIKHAHANNLILQCSQNENTMFITFEDNGIGFDMASISDKKGMGLENLKNRIAFLQGKFEVHSMPGEGTSIDIELKTSTDE
ncbi:tetratricopeptide repeat-containing sensor histidine kinase [Pedobacter zeae]|uniref:histidine kinase n=1 Tax=Pedobacter zeae TaxID=1737356 RepID=A0A7W6K9I6_9SPHI|nr:ATP-binding protein [Pedobacter zeae]MBB4106726.1 signal transduction histidine kinase [Pedobacter zeae]GGH03376.1 two-component sensor histidine kinase [Pedobacter zeae]